MTQQASEAPPLLQFTPYQKFVVAMLAFLQFTIILDFMILSPLGVMLMPTLKITPSQFGLVVSAYAFSAGTSGLLAAGFADRFDRKKLLLFFYSGFVVGTFLCGIADSYQFLMVARVVTGLFGGVVGSVVFAITTDLFSFAQRGRVMGIIQTAFAGSQILGIPIGLYLANKWNWHAPFLMVVLVGAVVGLIMWRKLLPIDAHLKLRTETNAFRHLLSTVTTPKYMIAFLTSALMTTGGFMLMPFGSAFSVNNLGIGLDELPMVYMVTGLGAIFAGPLIGRACDKYGKFKVFVFGSIVSVITVMFYTRLNITPLWEVIGVSVIMFVGISSRMISSQALMSAIPAPDKRGAFMAIGASIQQFSGGLASILAGLIVVVAGSGKLEHFNTLGNVVVGATIVTAFLMYLIHKAVPEPRISTSIESSAYPNGISRIRAASVGDAKDIVSIYAPFVEKTAVSFETVIPSENEMASRIAKALQVYPWIVAERHGQVIGYAYASQHRAREAYRWSADVTVYVDQNYLRQGVGRDLYRILLGQLEQLGYANAFAGIALPNASSIALHESFGFTSIGIYQKVGFKLGAWHDVGWWQKSFSHPERPKEPACFRGDISSS